MKRTWVLVTFLLTAASSAWAGDKDVCIDAHLEAQALRKSGALKKAREKLAVCSRASCPAPIVEDCRPWTSELEREQPTVILSVRSEAGREIAGVRMFIDDELVAPGEKDTLEVDPGTHHLRVEADGYRPSQAPLIVRSGEKDRSVSLVLEPTRSAVFMPAPARVEPERRGRSWLPTSIAAGVGGVALGGFAYFGLTGNAEKTHLRETCSPNCEPSAVDAIRRDYLVANVALGVAVVSLGVAAYLFFQR